MNTQLVASTMLLLVAIVCLAIAIRAFYVYVLSQSEMLFILGLAMSSIALSIFCGYVGDTHLAGVTFNTQWAWYVGSTSGALFLFLSSLVKTAKQLRLLKRWQVIATVLLLLVVLLTPVLPAFSSPLIPASLNICRTLLYCLGFLRYATLYLSKETRFSLITCVAFLLLAVGFGVITPQLFQPSLVLLAIVGSGLRIIGYLTLLVAYSIG